MRRTARRSSAHRTSGPSGRPRKKPASDPQTIVSSTRATSDPATANFTSATGEWRNRATSTLRTNPGHQRRRARKGGAPGVAARARAAGSSSTSASGMKLATRVSSALRPTPPTTSHRAPASRTAHRNETATREAGEDQKEDDAGRGATGAAAGTNWAKLG